MDKARLLIDGAFTVAMFVLVPVCSATPTITGQSCAYRTFLALTGETAEDAFGVSVAGAGDMNGDGYADVIVGAFDNGAGGPYAGRAYVFFGGPTADVVADLTLTGEAERDNFGVSVAGAGDVNHDGFADVIVGAQGNDAGGIDAGRAYIYFGGPGADANPDLVLTGELADGSFGVSVSAAGDVNADGYADMIVGAHLAGLGHAYVYFGGPKADAVADVTLTGESPGGAFGFSVSGGGDLNGDGFADLAVGKIGQSGPANPAQVFIYYGGPGFDATADLTLPAPGDNWFGWSVENSADVNGDGHADLIVGEPGDHTAGPFAGRAYVYYGGPVLDAMPDLALTGASAGDYFGRSVAGIEDVDGDGFKDVIVGAVGEDSGGMDAGSVYVYYGGPSVDSIADQVLTAHTVGEGFGGSVGSAGDVNGDGLADLIVGAVWGEDGAGRAYVIGHQTPLPATSDVGLALLSLGLLAGGSLGLRHRRLTAGLPSRTPNR